MPKAIKVCHHSSNTFLSTRQIEEFIKDKANQTLVAWMKPSTHCHLYFIIALVLFSEYETHACVSRWRHAGNKCFQSKCLSLKVLDYLD